MTLPLGVIIALIVLLVAAALCCGIFFMDRRHLRAQRDTLQRERDEARVSAEAVAAEASQLRTQVSVAEQSRKDAEEHFKQTQKQSQDTFDALAADVLKKSVEYFQKQADVTFEGKQKQNTQAIEAIVKPIREKLDQHAKAVAEMEKHREGAYHGLNQRLTSMIEDQRLLRDQAATLSNALRRTDVRGRWGEITLRRIAEMAGMVPHCDFDEQVTIWKGDASQRPDMVVKMPSDRMIIVDAKGVGNSYLKACEATEPAQRQAYMQQHLRDIESRVRDLSAKAYYENLEGSPDFVVLFIPGESFLHPAAELRPDLIEWALVNHVAIATPTTLIGLLKVIELGWREERLAENATKISQFGRDLHERLATAFTHLGKLGSSMETTVKHYNSLVGSLEHKVLPQSRRFKELGADSAKEHPAELKSVDTSPRTLSAPELTESDTST